MIPRVRFGRTELQVTRIGLGGFPFGFPHKAHGWDPLTPEGQTAAIAVIRAALDTGINYIDTAPSYGNGNSESIIGEAVEGRRTQVVLATKVSYRISPEEVLASVEASKKRLRTDVIDIIQFHGGKYTNEDVDHILKDGVLNALLDLRDKGHVRFVGFTVEEPWTALPLIATGQFDVMQVRYNFIHQNAAEHALDGARKADMGVATMRTLTSGIMQRIASYIAPRWQDTHDLYEVALKFVLSDSRVHVALVGITRLSSLAKNVSLVESFKPPFDMAKIPRSTAGIFRTDDEMVAE